jgi:hypothetical protein
MNTVTFLLSATAVVQKMNVSGRFGNCHGQPEKTPKIKAWRGFVENL